MEINLKKPTKKQIIEYAVIGLLLIATVIMFLGLSNNKFSFRVNNTNNVSYVKATVQEVISQDLSNKTENPYQTGKQVLSVKINEGDFKGEIIQLTHYITPTFQLFLKQGSNVILRADLSQGTDPFFSVYSYNRTFPIAIIVLFFLALVIIIGRKKGFLSCVGLLFTMATIICFMLPRLYEGGNTFAIIFITVLLSASATCFCINGFSKKTVLNLSSILCGSLSAVLLYYLFMLLLNFNGSAMAEAENLLLISYSTNLNLTGVLFAGVTVSALGAVMDVAVSLGASLSEIKDLNPGITSKELFKSGMNIGRDMIGTMTNTLILAFAGGAVATMLILISYGVQFHQLLSSNFIALELATGIAGSAAVVLTVPISSAINSFCFKK
ncbi:MAG: YibE/F family protein [Clostridia bacterium]|nr:YibE/F family protein [Clostridia bacterium]